MSKLTVDQKTILSLFTEKNVRYIIPDYQRPYAWDKEKCEVLWDDLLGFCIPNDNEEDFNDQEEYYLGSIVTYNNDGKLEVIDGQQRLTTLMLLLRAFYVKFENMKDKQSVKTKENLEQCIWQTDDFGEPDKEKLKIESEVATDNDKEEFLYILKNGEAPNGMNSKYANNYRFFEEKIDQYIDKFPAYISKLVIRILKYCILLPIEAESQDTALRIFSTLNDRGMPLSDSDIFKSQFYNYFKKLDRKDEFIEKWKELDEKCSSVFDNGKGNYMDEVFTRYMYYLRATQGNTRSTTEALRKFYEKNKYELLHNEETFNNLMDLVEFWEKIYRQDADEFSEDVLKKFSCLNYAPNSMWTFFVTVYYFAKRDENNELDMEDLSAFLSITIGFIFGYQFTNPGVNSLRTPIYNEMVNLVNGKEVTFKDYLFDAKQLKNTLNDYYFTNSRTITKSMLIWWAYYNFDQDLLDNNEKYEIEHIYAKKRDEIDPLSEDWMVESIGNKAFLEKRINIRAADYRFSDKKKYYTGKAGKAATIIEELLELSDEKDFKEQDILDREQDIINGFIEYLDENGLIKKK